MKRRFEFVEGSSSKFWEINLVASSVTTTFGRIGTDGQVSTKEFSSPAEALREAEKLITSKSKKGYAEAGKSGARPEVKTLAKQESSAPASKALPKKARGVNLFTTKKLKIAKADETDFGHGRGALSPDGTFAVRAVNGRKPLVLGLSDGSEEAIAYESRYVSRVEISPWGQVLLSDDKGITIFDATNKKPKTHRFKGASAAVMAQPGVIAAVIMGELQLLDAKSGQRLGRVIQKNVGDVVLSSQGVLATTHQSKGETKITLWYADGKSKELLSIPNKAGHDKEVRFSPEGSRVAFLERTYNDQPWMIRLCDVATGRLISEHVSLGLTLHAKVFGWRLLSDEAALVLWSERHADRDQTLTISTLDLRDPKKALQEETRIKGFDPIPALGQAGVLVNRGVFLENEDFSLDAMPDFVAAPWGGDAPVSKEPPAKKTKKPTLYLPKDAVADLKRQGALDVLALHVLVKAFAEKSADRRVAEAAADVLDGEVFSTDTDSPFYACVLDGIDPDDPKKLDVEVEQATRKQSAAKLIDEHLPAAKKAAGVLEDVSSVRRIHLRAPDSPVSLMLTLAQSKTASPGLLVYRVDT
ncbi:MAG: WGR domain-containing protein [Polyangiaceae bacterium]|nr:WGR domain-containing protein [Polyangiaceae bacterium]